MNTLLLFSDILCIQEHFLLDSKDKKHSNTNKLRNSFGTDHDMFITPAHKAASQVTRGRRKGGLVTMWKKGLTKYVSKVHCLNFRIQATKFKLPAGPVLVVNSYFPCDPRTENFDDSELVTLLSELRSVIQSSNCNNVLLAGDLNCHFERQTRFTTLIEDELADLGFDTLLAKW